MKLFSTAEAERNTSLLNMLLLLLGEFNEKKYLQKYSMSIFSYWVVQKPSLKSFTVLKGL